MATNAIYTELIEKQKALESTIEKKLKWAAGANPKLNSVLNMFSSAQATRTTVIQVKLAFSFDFELCLNWCDGMGTAIKLRKSGVTCKWPLWCIVMCFADRVSYSQRSEHLLSLNPSS